ncbi:hypothetical protein MAR_024769 [Mya arenaria]|uniref:Uncharacterized protein n=1 Tax=Mya arenaria TaxID=6604 RepID=A0ABY7DRR4_MYAAR|nr:hypothetical protein MAR_024769 [Mya arenaria]
MAAPILIKHCSGQPLCRSQPRLQELHLASCDQKLPLLHFLTARHVQGTCSRLAYSTSVEETLDPEAESELPPPPTRTVSVDPETSVNLNIRTQSNDPTTKDYQWSERESTSAGTPLTDVVFLAQAAEKDIKVLVAVEGVNACWKDIHSILDEAKQPGFEFMDPFIPIQVPEFSNREAFNMVDYLIERKWIQRPSDLAQISKA